MAKPGELRFGDYVSYDLRASHGGGFDHDYVLGVMDYSHLDKRYKTDTSVILLGGPQHIGMPINVGHCTLVSRGHDAKCKPWRARYVEQFPKALFPETELTD